MPSPKYFKCNVLLDIYFLLEVVTRWVSKHNSLLSITKVSFITYTMINGA